MEAFMKKREARYLVLENISIDDPVFGPGLQLDCRDTFPTIQEALDYIMEDAQLHYQPGDGTHLDEPDTTACSRKMIVRVIEVLRPVPTISATWELEHETV